MKGYADRMRKLRADLLYWQGQSRQEARWLRQSRQNRRDTIRKICALKREKQEGKP